MNHVFRTPLEKKFETQELLIDKAVNSLVEESISLEKGDASNLSEIALELVRLYQIAYALPSILTEVRAPKFGTIIDNTITLTYYFYFLGADDYLEYMPKENPVNSAYLKDIRYAEECIEVDIVPHGTDFTPEMMMNIDAQVRGDIMSIQKVLHQTAKEIELFNFDLKEKIPKKLKAKVNKKLKTRNKS